MIYPKILYSNSLRGITPSWSGTTLSGKPPANAIDWSDYSYFEADTGVLDFTVAVDTALDTFSAYVAKFTGSGAETIELQYESAASTFTSLVTINPAGGKLTFNEFTAVTVLATRKIRIIITVGTGALLIRQLVAGSSMVAEQGQYQSATSPRLLGGVKVTNTISANGSILGRSIKRVERMGKLELEYLSPAWVRSTWEPFAAHAARYPFIYAWNTRDYPTEIAFSACEGIETPKHMGKGDKMSASMKLRNLIADEFAI
tara:strand:+ start:2643 stop:3419 length:777 start_codon:yes stop_codon:yes gene_type:complete